MTAAPDRWEWGLFPVPTPDGFRYRSGCFWRGWGIYRIKGSKRYVVTHRPSGGRLTEFDRLRYARRFGEAIDSLTDWSRPHAELTADDDLGQQLHRAALRVTGAKPELRVIAGAGR